MAKGQTDEGGNEGIVSFAVGEFRRPGGELLCPRRQSNQNATGVCSKSRTPDPVTGDAYLLGFAIFPARGNLSGALRFHPAPPGA